MFILANRHRELGATCSEEGEPLIYVNQDDEYGAVSALVGLADISSRSKIEVTGDDRKKFLNNMCTNDFKGLKAGKGLEAFFLDAKGHVVDYAHVYNLGKSVWLDLAPGRAAKLCKHLDRYIITEDVQLHDRTDQFCQFYVAGPAANAFLYRQIDLDLERLEPLDCLEMEIQGIPCQVRRRDLNQLLGFEFLVPVEHGHTLWDAILCCDEPFCEHISGIRVEMLPVGSAVLNVFRIEAGIPQMGAEIGEDNLAQELGRNEQAIHFNKGCYIGQETVARLDAMGHVNKVLRGLVFDDEMVPNVGDRISVNGKEVGTIGSAGYSTGLGRAIALAILRVKECPPNTVVDVGEKLRATVVTLPIN